MKHKRPHSQISVSQNAVSRTPVSQPPVFPVARSGPFFLTPGFLILAIVAILCLIALLGPITTLSQSIAKNNQLNEELASVEEEYQKALTELEKWNDQQYVISQARENLGYVQEGETKISLIGEISEQDLENYQNKTVSSEQAEAERMLAELRQTWYQRLLKSFQ
jgi:cell division protein FtsB